MNYEQLINDFYANINSVIIFNDQVLEGFNRLRKILNMMFEDYIDRKKESEGFYYKFVGARSNFNDILKLLIRFIDHFMIDYDKILSESNEISLLLDALNNPSKISDTKYLSTRQMINRCDLLIENCNKQIEEYETLKQNIAVDQILYFSRVMGMQTSVDIIKMIRNVKKLIKFHQWPAQIKLEFNQQLNELFSHFQSMSPILLERLTPINSHKTVLNSELLEIFVDIASILELLKSYIEKELTAWLFNEIPLSKLYNKLRINLEKVKLAITRYNAQTYGEGHVEEDSSSLNINLDRLSDEESILQLLTEFTNKINDNNSDLYENDSLSRIITHGQELFDKLQAQELEFRTL